MSQTRRKFLRSLAGLGGLCLTGAAKSAFSRYHAPLCAALAFLEGRQSRDGAWRSDHYGAFRDGDALTPLVLWAMQAAPPAMIPRGAFARGLRWLERLTDGQVSREGDPGELRYPLFTASYAAQLFAKAGDANRAAVWAQAIERLRTSSVLGWPANDPSCGAWGDSPVPPQLPKDVQPPPDMLAPNLSATVLGARALASCGRSDRIFEARSFIESCQNFASESPSDFNDGGFIFAPGDSVRNKAGASGRDAAGRLRFNSYGSATCDGFLALHFCGLGMDHPRMVAAAAWIQHHGAGLGHTGRWMPGRGGGRESLVFYYGQALADVLAVLSRDLTFRDWAATQQSLLASDLIERQRGDGAWEGRAPNSCEDDPLLATAFGARALAQIAVQTI